MRTGEYVYPDTDIMMSKYRKECEDFQGDKAKFWSGKMSIYIQLTVSGSPIVLSRRLEILDAIRQEYDNIIFSRCEQE